MWPSTSREYLFERCFPASKLIICPLHWFEFRPNWPSIQNVRSHASYRGSPSQNSYFAALGFVPVAAQFHIFRILANFNKPATGEDVLAAYKSTFDSADATAPVPSVVLVRRSPKDIFLLWSLT
ncbi:hypothetical protein ASPSYDRAFT_327667 [Aspergillus sydowii CBS 593.65]|uniref:Uncharacterized protein n=1 Tax=Aspergillus sydowii CBS 593.65 TaxID=1036612 RepID=A0A1L9TYG9_9EURO|nr:uncharacterized protein ASPSYDRAFT_327667 [Aspergillus sydowii CBS 593.65]OJJ64484.1 hypothetical protein ASPSYDRAFT_327667 [Aspergillus sydowii CBS 593.65]